MPVRATRPLTDPEQFGPDHPAVRRQGEGACSGGAARGGRVTDGRLLSVEWFSPDRPDERPHETPVGSMSDLSIVYDR